MTINQQDILNSILESLDRIDYIKPKEIPNIDLYMDQVTTFMEEHLSSSKRYLIRKNIQRSTCCF